MEQEVIPVHQWTDGGAFVRVVRCINMDGTSYGGFVNPLVVGETVTAPDWRSDEECCGGIHGWPWALYVGDGKEPDYGALWQVVDVDPADVAWLGGKVKFRTGRVSYCGGWSGAIEAVRGGLISWVQQAAKGAANATVDYGAASATGNCGAASATGYRGAASATGERSSAAVTGLGGRAMCGENGCIALAYEQPNGKRVMHCASVVQNGIKPNVWYTLNEVGEFVEVGA